MIVCSPELWWMCVLIDVMGADVWFYERVDGWMTDKRISIKGFWTRFIMVLYEKVPIVNVFWKIN